VYLSTCRCGADVVATDLKQDMCADTLSSIKQLGRQVEFVPCDVRERTSVDDAVKEVEK
jgi:NAD(P)-dependent dehydrogenase (short-subunit alcohol dehydrogenase family)